MCVYLQVEYIGLQPSVGTQLPDIDATVKHILREREGTEQGMYTRYTLHGIHYTVYMCIYYTLEAGSKTTKRIINRTICNIQYNHNKNVII